MKRLLTGLAVLMILPASMCDNQRVVYKTRYVAPTVSEELRTPCPVIERQVKGVQGIALVLEDTNERADCNAIKITKTDEILDNFEKRVADMAAKEGTDG